MDYLQNNQTKEEVKDSGIWHEIWAFFTKVGPMAMSILFGLFGKVGMEIMMKKRYTFIQWVGVVMVSVFSGYMSAVICDAHDWEIQSRWIVPLATIMGQNIAFYFVYNYKGIFDSLLDFLMRLKRPRT